MQNFNPMVLQSLLNNLQFYQAQQYNPQIAFAPMTPEQQAWANNQKRLDPTQQDTNVNYIPTYNQLYGMNAFNAKGLNTTDRDQMLDARAAYDEAIRRMQGK